MTDGEHHFKRLLTVAHRWRCHPDFRCAFAPAQVGSRRLLDVNQRRGAQSIGSRLTAAHADKLSGTQYGEVAKEVTAQVAYIVQTCKLEPAADAVLHVIVGDMLAGADAMQGKVKGSAPRTGFVKVVQALDNYAAYFEHPGWKPLKH